MTAINVAYEILSDPEKRSKHDKWIAEQEKISHEENKDTESKFSRKTSERSPSQNVASGVYDRGFSENKNRAANIYSWMSPYGFGWRIGDLLIRFAAKRRFGKSVDDASKQGKRETNNIEPSPTRGRNIVYIFVVCASIWAYGNSEENNHKKHSTSPVSTETKTGGAYVRSATTPVGRSWPTTSAYLEGILQSHQDGASTITIDNSRNDSDVFVKLFSLEYQRSYPVRVFFVAAHDSFILSKVTSGTYDIRYQNLNTGKLSRSEPISLEEMPSYSGTQYSNVTLTLYKVRDGNMRTYELPSSEF